jgi:hypothetical protein
MSWTDPTPELSAEDKLHEQLKGLPMRDHVSVLVTMTLLAAQRDQIEPSHFKDLVWTSCRNVKLASAFDTLQFLTKQLEAAPDGTTAMDVLIVLQMMSLKTLEQSDRAAADLQKLVALLPSESGAPNARK